MGYTLSSQYSGQLGLSNVFSFLEVSLGSSKTNKHQTGGSTESTKEKVHTPDSLYAKMRERLHGQNLVKSLAEPLRSGDFVECTVVLQRNPLVEALETIIAIAEAAIEITSPTPRTQVVGARNSQVQANKAKNTLETKARTSSAANETIAQLRRFLKMVQPSESSHSVDLLGKSVGDSGFQLVLSLDPAFMGNFTEMDLLDGVYMIFGKVIKVVLKDSDDAISLLRKTALDKAPGLMKEVVVSMTEPLNRARDLGLTLPEVVTQISGPALQVIPISIFA